MPLENAGHIIQSSEKQCAVFNAASVKDKKGTCSSFDANAEPVAAQPYKAQYHARSCHRTM
jgi:hypothetical protein